MCEKLKVFTPVLGKDITLEANSQKGPKHAALEQILYEELMPQYDVDLNVNWVLTEPYHTIVEVTMWSDKLSRKIVVNGESTKESLQTTVAMANPSTMAFNRAIDRAILKFLGIYGIYAESENVIQDLNIVTDYNGSSITSPMPENPPQELPVVCSEQDEFEILSRKICHLKTYTHVKTGQKGFLSFGLIAKNKPEDLYHMAQINAGISPQQLQATEPQKAEDIKNLYRFLELRERFSQ